MPLDPFAASGLKPDSAPLALNRSGTNAEVVSTPARTRMSYVMVLFTVGYQMYKCFYFQKAYNSISSVPSAIKIRAAGILVGLGEV
jgi:hypothetical protein